MSPPLVKVRFPLAQDADGYPPVAVESVWASPTADPDEFVLDNVPFFARAATLGDTVVVTHAPGGQRTFERVAVRSGNSLIRVVFFDSARRDPVDHRLQSMGCSTEYLGAHSLLAVSIPHTTPLVDVQAYLQAEAKTGFLDYEEPILRQ